MLEVNVRGRKATCRVLGSFPVTSRRWIVYKTRCQRQAGRNIILGIVFRCEYMKYKQFQRAYSYIHWMATCSTIIYRITKEITKYCSPNIAWPPGFLYSAFSDDLMLKYMTIWLRDGGGCVCVWCMWSCPQTFKHHITYILVKGRCGAVGCTSDS